MDLRRISRAARALALAALLGLATAAAWLVGAPSLELLREHQGLLLEWRRSKLLGLTAGLIAANVLVVALCLPGSFAVTVASGFLFGFPPGTALAVLSGAVGAWLVFLWVRAGFGNAIHARLKAQQGITARLLAALHRNEFRCLILMRVIPVVPFMVANVAPALLGVGMRRFVVTTLIGIAPGTALTAWIGAGAAAALAEGGRAELDALLGPGFYGLLLAIAVLMLLPIALRRRGWALLR